MSHIYIYRSIAASFRQTLSAADGSSETGSKCCQLLSLMAASRCSSLLEGVGEAVLCAAGREGLVAEAACGALPFMLSAQQLEEVLQGLARAEVHLNSAPRLRSFLSSLAELLEDCDSQNPLLPLVPQLMKLLLELHEELRKASRLQRCQQHCFQAWLKHSKKHIYNTIYICVIY